MANQLPTISVEIAELNRATNRVTITQDKQAFSLGREQPYKALPNAFRPALEKIADYVRTEMIPRTFTKEGPGWAPLAGRTVSERIAAGYGGHHPILRRSGDLFKELTERSHPHHLEIIKVGKNARIEIGGTSPKFKQNQTGIGEGSQRLPQRPMIPGTGGLQIPDRDMVAMRQIIIKAINQKMSR